jgi:ligand-binding sensor domain-containing protein
VDPGGFLHMPTLDGLVRYRGDELFGHPLEAIARHPITAMRRDRDGNLWLGLRGLGLCRWNTAGFEEPGPESPLRALDISAIFEDGEGALWIGTRGAGLLRLSHAEVSKLSYPAGAGGVAESVLEDSRGALWVSAAGALLRSSEGRWTKFDSRNGLEGLPVRSMAEARDGGMWFGTQDGFLHQYAAGRFRHYWLAGAQGDTGPVTALCPAPDGSLWIGTGWSGAARWNSGQLEQFRVEHGLSSNRISAICADSSGDVWIGTEDRGLNWLHEGRIRPFTTRDGLGGDAIACLRAGGDGTVWIGTNGGGLSRWKNNRFRTYNYRQGLADDAIFAILEDKAGSLWMGSRRGVFRVRKADLDELDAGRSSSFSCRLYDESDGMWTRSVTGFNQPAASSGSGKRMWFATERGVVWIEAGRPEVERRAPGVLLEEVVVDGKVFEHGPVPSRGPDRGICALPTPP